MIRIHPHQVRQFPNLIMAKFISHHLKQCRPFAVQRPGGWLNQPPEIFQLLKLPF